MMPAQSRARCAISSENPPYKAKPGASEPMDASSDSIWPRFTAGRPGGERGSALLPHPTVTVLTNIGNGRIGTLLFFVTNGTQGTFARTGTGGRVCATVRV